MKSLILAWIRGLERLAIFESFREKSRFIMGDTTYYCVGLSGCVFGMDFATNTEGFTQHFHHLLDSLFIVYHKMIVLLLRSPYMLLACMGFFLTCLAFRSEHRAYLLFEHVCKLFACNLSLSV